MKIKSSVIGLFLIAIMLFSTFAYAFIQSISPQQNLEIPKSNIVEEPLDPTLKNVLMQYGHTVITLEYNMGCDSCLDWKLNLEYFANDYKEQTWLEEIVNETLQQPVITVSSLYGQEQFTGNNQTAFTDSICKLMVEPPVACALKQ